MAINISYMGTKRALAPDVAEAISKFPPGPLLDAFSGMCAIGSTVGTLRNIWSNDLQAFAHLVASAFFTYQKLPLNYESFAAKFLQKVDANLRSIAFLFDDFLVEEDRILKDCCYSTLRDFEGEMEQFIMSDDAKKLRSDSRRDQVYATASLNFSGGYFGLRQSLTADSIRFSADELLSEGEITSEQHGWMIIALCQGLSKITTSPGHFAQYLNIKSSNFSRIRQQRQRCLLTEWRKCYEDLCPIGGGQWRRENKTWNGDALDVTEDLRKSHDRPAVVYADPPYTSDHYSRYYHVHDTMVLYDFPDAIGKGRYRENRATSSFSVKTKAKNSIEKLVENVCNLEAGIVLSYPATGLLNSTIDEVGDLLKKYYGKKTSVLSFDHIHSSLGASKGAAKNRVKEYLFVGRC